MKTTKLQDTEILKELGELIFLAYEGTDPKIAVPPKLAFVDVLEGLRCLSLLIKYQRFDLEATRRENEFLQNLLRSK